MELLIAKASSLLLGVPSSLIVSLMRLDVAAPVPGMPPWLLGAAYLHGRLHAVIGASAAMPVTGEKLTPGAFGVVIQTSSRRVILQAERLLELVHVENPPPLGPGLAEDRIQGRVVRIPNWEAVVAERQQELSRLMGRMEGSPAMRSGDQGVA